jgi:hypothetical protein
MHRAAAALMVFSGELLAHPGHGAPENHLHGWEAEHVLLLAVVVAFLAFAIKKK